MAPNEFAGVLKLIVPKILDQYMKVQGVSWEIAIERLYNSTMYSALEDPETSLWHLSPLLLCDLLAEEVETGDITWPEEQ